MNTQEEITIKVPTNIALAYRNATEAEREQIQLKLATIMKLQFKTPRKEARPSADYAYTRLRNIMDAASSEAQAKGLTPEILELILNDE